MLGERAQNGVATQYDCVLPRPPLGEKGRGEQGSNVDVNRCLWALGGIPLGNTSAHSRSWSRSR